MNTVLIQFAVLWTVTAFTWHGSTALHGTVTVEKPNAYEKNLKSSSARDEYYYYPFNVSRSTPSGIAAYRSALTLDWLSAEDSRQREMVAAIESEPQPPSRISHSDCISYARPPTGTIARLMLELLKNLEGDDGILIPNLIQALVRSKLLVLETSMFENEPDLEALVKTPTAMMGEPHTTFPRILAILWMALTDPTTVKRHGWCTVNKITTFLSASRPSDIAKHMRSVEPIVARARFIMEEFIQQVTPLNMFDKASSAPTTRKYKPVMQKSRVDFSNTNYKRPVRTQPVSPTKTTTYERHQELPKMPEMPELPVKLVPLETTLVPMSDEIPQTKLRAATTHSTSFSDYPQRFDCLYISLLYFIL